VAVHTDGTIFVAQPFSATVVGIDPTTGAQKFSVPLTQGNANEVEDPYLAPGEANVNIYGSIIAGDGFAYVAYGYEDAVADSTWVTHLMLLQVDSSGNNNNIDVMDWTTEVPSAILSQVQPIMITNADQGIFLSWEADPLDHDGPLPKPYTSDGRLRPRSARRSSQLVTTGTRQAAPRDSYVETPTFGMAVVTTAGNVSLVNAPALPGQAGPIAPIVQAQDGSFVGSMGMQGTNGNYAQYSMVAFDASGNVRWTVPNEQPQIATADGGVVGQSGITYDSNGNATGQIGVFSQSWTMNAYQDGPVTQFVANPIYFDVAFAPFQKGNTSRNKTAQIPVDSKANDKVKGILTRAMWVKFAKSHCGSVFGNPLGIPLMIPNYSLQMVQQKQQMTNFYDVSDSQVGGLPLNRVTGGQYGSNVTLTNYLGSNNAATANMGYSRQTAVVLKQGILSQSSPEFTLVHELLLHAYAAQSDDGVFASAFFQQNGLWRPNGSTATTYITTWMSADCNCTPGGPVATCQANTAKW